MGRLKPGSQLGSCETAVPHLVFHESGFMMLGFEGVRPSLLSLGTVGIRGRPSGGVLCIGGWLATSWISTHQKPVAPPSWVVTAKDAPGLCQMPPVSRITPSWEPQRQMWCLWPRPVYTAWPSFTSSQAPLLPRWTLPDTLSKSQSPSTCVFLLNSSFFLIVVKDT